MALNPSICSSLEELALKWLMTFHCNLSCVCVVSVVVYTTVVMLLSLSHFGRGLVKVTG